MRACVRACVYVRKSTINLGQLAKKAKGICVRLCVEVARELLLRPMLCRLQIVYDWTQLSSTQSQVLLGDDMRGADDALRQGVCGSAPVRAQQRTFVLCLLRVRVCVCGCVLNVATTA